MNIRHILIAMVSLGLLASNAGAAPRELLNNDWKFSLGYAGDMQKDFTHGTEYFTYLCKVRANNQGNSPIVPEFDDSDWRQVSLPHDWVVDLPYSGEASHSHGYKCIGWKYPQNSVGWYRKHLFIPKEDEGKRIAIEFEGIFRDSEVFCNGFYLGSERSGYASTVYDISDVLNYGGDNIITVRADASKEEGWFYEGAGIYRNVYLSRGNALTIEPYGLRVTTTGNSSMHVRAKVRNFGAADSPESQVKVELLDADGQCVSGGSTSVCSLVPQASAEIGLGFEVADAHLWTVDDPYLYTLRVSVGEDVTEIRTGIRSIEFTHDNGMLLNGKRIQLKGCDLHQDQAGVGAGIPDELWRYKLGVLKSFGFNTIRSSHNPASPSLLSLCDELGFFVIDENRLMGPGDEQLELLERMIKRDANHPCVVIWSVGNEEWPIEWNIWGTKIAQRMTAVAHRADPTRPTIYASSSGQFPNYGCDVFGYNYIVQNPPMENWEKFPNGAMGTEETTGCGTRGKYHTNPEEGWMTSFNRSGVKQDLRYTPDTLNVIERGWKFYRDHPQFAGLCYWTGFDYRGEPNPMLWPATGSQFGLLDYCGFPKDEAFYLKAAWTDEPVLHICGEYNGEIWIYTNCEEVSVSQGGRVRRFRNADSDSRLVFPLKGNSKVRATGYRNGKKYTATYPEDEPKSLEIHASKQVLRADGQDVVVINIDGPEGTYPVSVKGAEFLGWGNGNPGFKEIERPLGGGSLPIRIFSGKAQLIIRSQQGHAHGDSIEITVGSASTSLSY